MLNICKQTNKNCIFLIKSIIEEFGTGERNMFNVSFINSLKSHAKGNRGNTDSPDFFIYLKP